MNLPIESDCIDAAKREQQNTREKSHVEDGLRRFRKHLKRESQCGKKTVEFASGHSRPATDLIRDYWEPLSNGIRAEQTSLLKRARKYGIFMLALDADSVAVIVLHAVIEAHPIDNSVEDDDEAHHEESESHVNCEDDGPDTEKKQPAGHVPEQKGTPLTRLAREIARRCKHHWDGMSIDEQNAGILRCVQKYSVTIQSRETRRIRDWLDTEWSERNRDIPFGESLLNIATKVGILSIATGRLPRRRKEAKLVEFSDAFEKVFIEWRKHHKELAAPFRRPMVCPPVRWNKRKGGGYLQSGVEKKMPMIKERMDAGPVDGILNTDWEPTHTAINAIQDTAWRINKKVFDTMREISRMHQAEKPLKLDEKRKRQAEHRWRNAGRM